MLNTYIKENSESGRNWYIPYEDCKVAILWKYFHDAFLFRCDGYSGEYGLFVVQKPKQEENWLKKIEEYVKGVMWTIDNVKGYTTTSAYIWQEKK